MIQKKRGRPPLNKKAIKPFEPIKRPLSRTRGHQNGLRLINTNPVTSQMRTRGSKRSLPLTTNKIETKAIPAKKVFKEHHLAKNHSHKEEEKKKIIENPEESDEEVFDRYVSQDNYEHEEIKIPLQKKEQSIKVPNGVSRSRRSKVIPKEPEEKIEEGNLKSICRKAVEKEFSIENFLKVEEKVVGLKQEYSRPCTYINCDLRYFNFDFLVDKLGFFDGKLFSQTLSLISK